MTRIRPPARKRDGGRPRPEVEDPLAAPPQHEVVVRRGGVLPAQGRWLVRRDHGRRRRLRDARCGGPRGLRDPRRSSGRGRARSRSPRGLRASGRCDSMRLLRRGMRRTALGRRGGRPCRLGVQGREGSTPEERRPQRRVGSGPFCGSLLRHHGRPAQRREERRSRHRCCHEWCPSSASRRVDGDPRRRRRIGQERTRRRRELGVDERELGADRPEIGLRRVSLGIMGPE